MILPHAHIPVCVCVCSEASAEATHIISAIGEAPSVPAPLDTEAAAAGKGNIPEHHLYHL